MAEHLDSLARDEIRYDCRDNPGEESTHDTRAERPNPPAAFVAFLFLVILPLLQQGYVSLEFSPKVGKVSRHFPLRVSQIVEGFINVVQRTDNVATESRSSSTLSPSATLTLRTVRSHQFFELYVASLLEHIAPEPA